MWSYILLLKKIHVGFCIVLEMRIIHIIKVSNNREAKVSGLSSQTAWRRRKWGTTSTFSCKGKSVESWRNQLYRKSENNFLWALLGDESLYYTGRKASVSLLLVHRCYCMLHLHSIQTTTVALLFVKCKMIMWLYEYNYSYLSVYLSVCLFVCLGVYILIGVGSVMMFVGFLGCYGAIQESQCLLGTVSHDHN